MFLSTLSTRLFRLTSFLAAPDIKSASVVAFSFRFFDQTVVTDIEAEIAQFSLYYVYLACGIVVFASLQVT